MVDSFIAVKDLSIQAMLFTQYDSWSRSGILWQQRPSASIGEESEWMMELAGIRLQRRDRKLYPLLTRSLSSLPTLKNGSFFSFTRMVSPVLGFRP